MPVTSPSVITTPAGDVIVVTVRGPLKLGHPPLEELQAAFRRLADNGQVQVVVDLTEMPLFDSTGIGLLVLGYTSMRRRGGTCKICGLVELARKMLKTVGLLNVFEVFPDRAQAVASFQK
ncbi:MAG: STAS domain-containing protein [Acidobacteriota bacterium]|nr:STAS domain-containing protein [Acidobacteriota bacterium]